MKNVQQGLVMTDADGEWDTILDDMGQIVPGAVVTLHNNMIDALRKAYPAFKDTWHLSIDTRGGIVQVRNLLLSKDMGFVLHITKIDPEMRKIREAAGELFERFGVARERGLSIKQAMKNVMRDKFGRIISEK